VTTSRSSSGEDTTWIQASRLEADRLAACRPDATLLDVHELGFKELSESGISRAQLELELAATPHSNAVPQDAPISARQPAAE